jgi:predicted anti-sigma-YlaC factor YlaD
MVLWWRTTTCERAAQWISLELDGELSELERARLVRHLDRCASCRAWSADVGGFTTLLRTAPLAELSAPVTAPAGFARAKRRVAVGALAAAAAAAAALLIALPEAGRTGSSGAIAFEDAKQQQRFAQEHVQTELAAFLVAPTAPAQSFASRALL